LKIAVEAYNFDRQDEEFYFKDVNSLRENWKECINVAGEYIAKLQHA